MVEKGDTIVTLRTKYSKDKQVEFHAPKELTKYANHPIEKEDIIFEYNGKSIITPNMKQGTKLGDVNVIYHNEIIETFEIVLSSSIPFSLFSFLVANRFFFIIGILLILCTVFVIQKIITKMHRKKSVFEN